MPIRRRVSGAQELVSANVIEQQEARARLMQRANDDRGVFDPKKDPYPGSWPDQAGVAPENARSIVMGLSYMRDQPEPQEVRTQDLLVNLRMMNNPGDSVERTYRNRIGSPLTAIRAFCVECKGGSPRAVAKCDTTSCVFWALRMGRNRFRNK